MSRITGNMPFMASNVGKAIDRNQKCNVNFETMEWIRVSNETKDLTKRMMEKDPRLRINTKDAMAHPWFTLEFTGKNTLSIKKESIDKYFNDQMFNMEKIKPDFYKMPMLINETSSAPIRCFIGKSAIFPNSKKNKVSMIIINSLNSKKMPKQEV